MPFGIISMLKAFVHDLQVLSKGLQPWCQTLSKCRLMDLTCLRSELLSTCYLVYLLVTLPNQIETLAKVHNSDADFAHLASRLRTLVSGLGTHATTLTNAISIINTYK